MGISCSGISYRYDNGIAWFTSIMSYMILVPYTLQSTLDLADDNLVPSKFLSASQNRAYCNGSSLVLDTTSKFLPLVPLFTVSTTELDSVLPCKDYIL